MQIGPGRFWHSPAPLAAGPARQRWLAGGGARSQQLPSNLVELGQGKQGVSEAGALGGRKPRRPAEFTPRTAASPGKVRREPPFSAPNEGFVPTAAEGRGENVAEPRRKEAGGKERVQTGFRAFYFYFFFKRLQGTWHSQRTKPSVSLQTWRPEPSEAGVAARREQARARSASPAAPCETRRSAGAAGRAPELAHALFVHRLPPCCKGTRHLAGACKETAPVPYAWTPAGSLPAHVCRALPPRRFKLAARYRSVKGEKSEFLGISRNLNYTRGACLGWG